MKNNLGNTDKTIRIVFALIISIFVFGKIVPPPFSIFFFLLSLFLVGTFLKGNCPLYRILGLNTKRNLNDKAGIHERNKILHNNYFKNLPAKLSRNEKASIKK